MNIVLERDLTSWPYDATQTTVHLTNTVAPATFLGSALSIRTMAPLFNKQRPWKGLPRPQPMRISPALRKGNRLGILSTLLANKYRQIGAMAILWLWALVSISYSEEQKLAEPGDIDGEIIVEVMVSRENHNRFVISPRKGTITSFDESASPQLTDGGAVRPGLSSCYTNPTSVSPNSTLIAACSGQLPGSTNDRFVLQHADSKAIIYQNDLHQRIEDSEWSKDSKGIAFLAITVRVSLNPLYWLLALSGHPVQYETYFLHVINVETLKGTTFKLPIEGRGGGGYIVMWKQDR